MRRFRLKEITATRCGDRDEETYAYVSDEGETVKFHAHPTAPFNYVVVEGDRKTAAALIEEFVEAGLAQHEFDGGFRQAIDTLTVG